MSLPVRDWRWPVVRHEAQPEGDLPARRALPRQAPDQRLDGAASHRSDDVSLPLLLGEMPSRAGDRYHEFPLSGAIGKRLCEWAGIEPTPLSIRDRPRPRRYSHGDYYWALREKFDCLNAMERHQPRWNAETTAAARERWWTYLTTESRHVGLLTVVCLGRRAAEAVWLPPRTPWGDWCQIGQIYAVAIPHPSGRNLLYNDGSMVELARRVLRKARA